MPEVFGEGNFQYAHVDDWAKLPQGMSFHECPGVAVDSQDNVYVLTRGDDPIMVFDREGNFIRTFGKGEFSNRTHGLYIAHDDSILAADDGIHTIQKFNPEGDKLLEVGQRNQPAPIWSGQPFNRPTSAAIMPSNGDLYISDGYGNSRIHVYTGAGIINFPGAAQVSTPDNSSVPTTSLSTATTGFTWWTGRPTAYRFSTPKATS